MAAEKIRDCTVLSPISFSHQISCPKSTVTVNDKPKKDCVLTNCILALNYATLQEKCIQSKRSAWLQNSWMFLFKWSLFLYFYSVEGDNWWYWLQLPYRSKKSFSWGRSNSYSNSTKSFQIRERKQGTTAGHLLSETNNFSSWGS